ncbi:heme A synthase [Mesonia sp. K7]|uniref:COX15/CtaA family protein n=1 Tax=Mesonia sp. K7 TaxID=2218606 RepID=UPI000DA98D81|nr:COX15/CtaA family protein [Mesonia sp. K7]PZD78248.1 heme A synthase [Mesonia sp. K7]
MYRKLIKISIVLVYLVIIAGAVVRMTGSGMGCPDWPKCFGYYIPPTEKSDLIWEENHFYEKGQVIILNNTLQVAKNDFTSQNSFNKSNWNLYTKHDYAEFNATHTWVEYINRLCGALAGFAVLLMALFSFRQKRKIILLSWLSVFLMGFQAWLGAVVVYSVLAPVKITIHMLMAFVIVGVLLYLLHQSKVEKNNKTYPKKLNYLLWATMILFLIQVVLGTQVRQFVDEQIKAIGYQKEFWLVNPEITFYIHRSASILLLALSFMLWRIHKKQNLNLKLISTKLVLMVLGATSGVLMAYFDFPFATQAMHLVLSSLIFGVLFYVILQTNHSQKMINN